jgi:hypothetical protein
MSPAEKALLAASLVACVIAAVLMWRDGIMNWIDRIGRDG